MTGGLMQLVAYGAQDIFLTGNPQITFWKVVYRRHTNFAMESIEQTFNGTVGSGSRVTATVARTGDLIHKMYLRFTLADDDVRTYVNNVELEIGGQRIDRQYGLWMKVWGELTTPEGLKAGYDRLVNADGTNDRVSYLPLSFWFCRNPGLALPLIALQYHEVKVNVEFTSSLPVDCNASLWVDYVYLDTDERRRFAQVSHEYLIEQVQHTGVETLTGSVRLNFNHPVKELVWVTGANLAGAGAAANYGTALLQLNGHDRFRAREALYFTHVQPYQHHTRVPAADSTAFHVSVYSFALKPEEHQPSGTCNFSRIDNATLQFTTPVDSQELYVYAVNYNVLRIMSGMGGLAYSN